MIESTKQALLNNIKASPHEASCYYPYADWLWENGNEDHALLVKEMANRRGTLRFGCRKNSKTSSLWSWTCLDWRTVCLSKKARRAASKIAHSIINQPEFNAPVHWRQSYCTIYRGFITIVQCLEIHLQNCLWKLAIDHPAITWDISNIWATYIPSDPSFLLYRGIKEIHNNRPLLCRDRSIQKIHKNMPLLYGKNSVVHPDLFQFLKMGKVVGSGISRRYGFANEWQEDLRQAADCFVQMQIKNKGSEI